LLDENRRSYDYHLQERFPLKGLDRKMTKSNEYYAYFSLSGSFDPGEISKKTGISPTECSREGDLIPGTQHQRKCSRWSLYSRLQKSDSDLEHHIVDVLNQLDAHTDAIKQLSIEFEGVMQLVAYFGDNSGPGISFGREVIRRLAEYSLYLDCDFYYPFSEKREAS
jgi:hypothetical protein